MYMCMYEPSRVAAAASTARAGGSPTGETAVRVKVINYGFKWAAATLPWDPWSVTSLSRSSLLTSVAHHRWPGTTYLHGALSQSLTDGLHA